MNKSIIRNKFELLTLECALLVRMAEVGMLTEQEKRRRCNELAREYIRLSSASRKSFGYYVGAYVEQACLKIAMRLKYVAAKPQKSVRKRPSVKRKVITKPMARRWQ